MKLNKAIEIQTIHNDHNPNFTDTEREEAHQLSIEALKRLQRLRSDKHCSRMKPLPGETED